MLYYVARYGFLQSEIHGHHISINTNNPTSRQLRSKSSTLTPIQLRSVSIAFPMWQHRSKSIAYPFSKTHPQNVVPNPLLFHPHSFVPFPLLFFSSYLNLRSVSVAWLSFRFRCFLIILIPLHTS